MKKRCFSLLLALVMLLSLLPGTALAADLPPTYILAGGNAQSGALGREPLSKKEIYDLLQAAPLDGSNFYYKPSGAFDSAPSITEPYSPGKVSDSALQKALGRLNALRALAGLPAVALDSDLCENAQYGALAMAYLGTITHDPAQGSTADAFGKLPSDIQTKAAEAARSSNLSAGSNLTWAVDSLMDDSDMSNIDRLGHRRWQLNPSMGKVGFGYAVSDSSYSQYVVEKVFDTSRSGQVDYDFVAWPASGNFPNNIEAFNQGTAWSVTLNPKNYSTPSLSSVTVTLTGGGKTWTLDRSGSDGYFNVDTGGYGVSNCIVFLPYDHAEYEGDYTVTVSGLKDKGGKDVTLQYTVSFFDASVEPTTPETPTTPITPSFTDVPANAWYAAPVAWAVEKGITNGTGANKFSPDKTCNNAEILTFLWRACGKPEAPAASFSDVASGVWYADAANWAKSKGMVSGDKLSPIEPCTRASAVMFIWQAMGKPTASKAASFSDVPANADYAAAVAWAVEKGVTNGTGADTFSPDSICNRAQIVAFLQRAYA